MPDFAVLWGSEGVLATSQFASSLLEPLGTMESVGQLVRACAAPQRGADESSPLGEAFHSSAPLAQNLSSYIGHEKTHLQHLGTVAAINVTRLID